jgi:hypothetical protein
MTLREELEKASQESIVETDKYRVDCCNKDCGWTGYSIDCVTFKHDSAHLMCPQCHEVVEPVQ